MTMKSPTDAAGHDVVPGEVVPDLDRAVAVDVEAEARLARALLDHEEPARLVVDGVVAARPRPRSRSKPKK